MKAFVTGGAGFIGSNIVRLLTERGHEVTVYDNLSTGHRCNLDPFPKVNFVQGDILDLASLKSAMQGSDTVFHLAASIGNAKSIEFPSLDSQINVGGTLNVLEAMKSCGAKTIVYSSSAGIFGEPQYQPVDEVHPCNPDSPYGVSKWAAEKHILCLSRLRGFRAVCVRYFNAYGVNQRYDAYGNVIPIFVSRALAGQPLTVFGDGEQTRDFVNAKDLAWANVTAAEQPQVSGTFNLGSGKSVTINHLIDVLRDIIGSPIEVRHAPPRPGDVRDSLANIRRAQATFHYNPSAGLEESLGAYVKWYRQCVS